MKHNCLLAMAIVAVITTAARADTTRVDVKLWPPPKQQLTQDDLWNAQLTTYGGPVEVLLKGYVMVKGDTVLRGFARNMLVLQNGMRRIQSTDITGVRDLKVKKEYEGFTVRGGQVPEGNYTFCLEVYEASTGRRLGGDCFEFSPVIPGAPRLVSPKDGDTIRTATPTFVWTPPSPMPKGRVTYELTIVEVRPGQTAEAALRDNKPFFKKTGLTTTSLTYPTSARQFEDTPIGGQGGGPTKHYANMTELRRLLAESPVDTARAAALGRALMKAIIEDATYTEPPPPPETEPTGPDSVSAKAYAWQVSAVAQGSAIASGAGLCYKPSIIRLAVPPLFDDPVPPPPPSQPWWVRLGKWLDQNPYPGWH